MEDIDDDRDIDMDEFAWEPLHARLSREAEEAKRKAEDEEAKREEARLQEEREREERRQIEERMRNLVRTQEEEDAAREAKEKEGMDMRRLSTLANLQAMTAMRRQSSLPKPSEFPNDATQQNQDSNNLTSASTNQQEQQQQNQQPQSGGEEDSTHFQSSTTLKRKIPKRKLLFAPKEDFPAPPPVKDLPDPAVFGTYGTIFVQPDDRLKSNLFHIYREQIHQEARERVRLPIPELNHLAQHAGLMLNRGTDSPEVVRQLIQHYNIENQVCPHLVHSHTRTHTQTHAHKHTRTRTQYSRRIIN